MRKHSLILATVVASALGPVAYAADQPAHPRIPLVDAATIQDKEAIR